MKSAITEEKLARLQGRTPPPASKLLGLEFIDLDVEAGWVECSFIATGDMVNPGGVVQGGFVSGMLDDAMSIAAVIVQSEPSWVPTLQMTTSFVRPVLPGKVFARGEVIRNGRGAVHTQGTLRDGDGKILAQATASCIPRPLPPQI